MKIQQKIILLIFILFLAFVQGGCCGYTVTFDESDSPYAYTEGGEKSGTFWDLPLWIQLSYITSLITGLFIAAKFFPPVAGRIKHVLDNKKRRIIYEHISECPGMSIKELADVINISRETLRYHLVCLEQSNKITVKMTDHSGRLFPNHNQFSDIERSIINICHNPTQVQIISLIIKYPGIRNSDLKDELNISKSAVTWQMNKLKKAGLLSVRISGRNRHNYIKSGIEQIAIKYLPEEIKDEYNFNDDYFNGNN